MKITITPTDPRREDIVIEGADDYFYKDDNVRVQKDGIVALFMPMRHVHSITAENDEDEKTSA